MGSNHDNQSTDNFNSFLIETSDQNDLDLILDQSNLSTENLMQQDNFAKSNDQL